MSSPKPRHLHADYAAQFADESFVAAYSARPPYPESVFEQLSALACPAGGFALDLGAGGGDVTFRLAERLAGVDAVEPSVAMRAAARGRASAYLSTQAIRWFTQTAESFEPERPYALVVAGESLHWMDWDVVMPMIARALAPGAVLAIIADRVLERLPWEGELATLIAQHSTTRDYPPYDIVSELSTRGLFRELGRSACYNEAFTQPSAAYVKSFHSRNGFSSERIDPVQLASFDAAVEALVRRYAPDGQVSCSVRSTLVWGTPNPS